MERVEGLGGIRSLGQKIFVRENLTPSLSSCDFAYESPVSVSMQRAKFWRRGAVEHRMRLR
jgi:hypothetical protein